MKRRHLVSGSAFAGAAFLPLGSNTLSRSTFAAQTSAVKADHIITNALIYSMDPARPQAEAIAVSGNRILALGSNEDMLALRGPATEINDAGGAVIFPGFIDAHSHPSEPMR